VDPTARLRYVHGKPTVRGSIKTTPEDFIVEEILSFEPSGLGEHAFVQVEKWGENTDFIARHLARFTGTKSRDIGFAGLKDRHGRTRQWFSVQLPGKDDPDWSQWQGEQFRVLAHTRNDRKLRRGAIKENRFTLTIRDLDQPANGLMERVNAIAATGVPNYFGPQRFGRDGDNVERALDLIRNPSSRINPNLRGIFLSAARSEIFNQILSERVLEGIWNQAVAGDVYMFPDSKSHFEADADDEDIKERIQRKAIHPSGPLVGEKPSAATEKAAEIENRILSRFDEIHEGLKSARLESLRRPFRLVPDQLTAEALDDGSLRLHFSLPAGTYATTVLRELINFESSQQPEV
jgi:tRNA pseudouridine13 synthase